MGFVGTNPLRRLSNVEYRHAMRDLFPSVTPADLPTLPDDTGINGFENDARALAPSDVAIARYESFAFRYASAATESDAALAAILPCTTWTTVPEQDACAHAFIARFGRRVFRRPLSEDEQSRYFTRFAALRNGIDFRAAIQLVAMALVQSPQFLYRLETPSVDATPPPGSAPLGVIAPIAIDDFALATRLAFMLWASTPDDALLDVAATGMLRDDTVLALEVDRMLADPRATDAIVDFHRQWLSFDRMMDSSNATRDPAVYPAWSVSVQASAREELDRLVRWEFSAGAGTVPELLTTRHAFVDANLAALYGVAGPSAPGEWAPVELPPEQRAGLLTRAGILAAHAHPGGISPPLRGVFVLERLLCQPHRSSPPGVDLSPPMPMSGEGPVTNRTLFERRTSPATCASCHTTINPAGFAFQHYDATGAYQSLDNGLAIDASGELLDIDQLGRFTDAVDLSERFATSDTVADCASTTWVRFALGRAPEREDGHLRRLARAAYEDSGGNVRAILRAIALSPELRLASAVQE